MKKLVLIAIVLLVAAAGPVLACGSKASVTGCNKAAESIDRTVTKLDNGVRIMLASADAEMVKSIQEKGDNCKGCCKDDCVLKADGVTRVVERTDTGLMITATSADGEMIQKLQTHAAAGDGGCKFKKGMKAGDEKPCPMKEKENAGQVAASR